MLKALQNVFIYCLHEHAMCHFSAVLFITAKRLHICSGGNFFLFNFTKKHGFSSLKYHLFYLEMCSTWTVLAPVWGNTYVTRKSSFRASFFLWLL